MKKERCLKIICNYRLCINLFFSSKSAEELKKNMVDKVTLEDIQKACEVLYASPDIVQTPTLSHVQKMFPGLENVDLYLKLENTQTTGKVGQRIS